MFLDRRAFSLFQTKIDVPSLRLADVVECIPGAEIRTEAFDQNLLLTIVARGEESSSRIIAIKLSSRDERNEYLGKFRCVY
jgi:hypothetical protein